MSKVSKKSAFFAIALIAVLGVLSLTGPVFAAGQKTAAGQRIADDTRPTGLKPVDAAQSQDIVKTKPRVDRVHLNRLGFDRVNEARAKQGKSALSSSLIKPLGQDLEASILDTSLAVQSTALAAALLADLPPSVDNSALMYFPPIRDQGLLNSCAPFATTYYQLSYMTAYQRELDIRNNEVNTDKYSPKWTYSMVNGGIDGGSYILENYDLIEKHGGATWAEFPYDADYLSWCLTSSAWRNALGTRTNPVQYVYDSDMEAEIGQIKAVLNNGYVLVFGTYVYSWQGQMIMDDPATIDDDAEVGRAVAYFVDGTKGSHAMTIVGYNDAIWTDVNGNTVVDPGEKGAFKIANSWGDLWMNSGFIWLAYDALRHVSALADGPSDSREPAFQGDFAFVMVPRADYEPLMIAEFTVNHALRNQLVMSLGTSATSETLPTTEWQPAAIQAQGGAHAFDGTATAVDGTFVFDLTDLLAAGAGEQKFYLGMLDTLAGDPATLSAFKIVDLTVPTEVAAVLDPALTADGGQVFASVNYTYAGPAANHAPTLNSGQVQPATGTTEDPYTYFVYYTDEDGDAPLTKSVYIDDTAYEMAPVETDPGWYYHISYLTVGIHSFRFLFADGNGGWASDPAGGTYSGPYVLPIHFVNAPSSPTGETVAVAGSSWTYATGGSICASGHDVQYRFDWGDGSVSDWLAVGQTTAQHAWANSGSYAVKAQARCAVQTTVESLWSGQLIVTVPAGIPFAESFASSGFPAGWIQQNEGENLASLWYLVASGEAGGQPYEMRRIYEVVNPGTTRLVTCPIDTTGHTALRLQFKHFLDTYATGGVVLKVQTSTDRVTWTDEAWSVTTSDVNIGPATVETTLTHNLDSETTFVGFVITGNFDLFDYWYVDDISITQAFTPKVDFNRDGHEDILWRYQAEGAYQGMILAWLMNWTETGAPIPLQFPAPTDASESVIGAAPAATASLAPPAWDMPRQSTLLPKSAFKTVLRGGKKPSLKSKAILRSPMEMSRKGKAGNRALPSSRDGVISAAGGVGELELASLTLGTEVMVSVITDLSWEIAGTSDFNGDGKTDILWRNYGTGPFQGMNDIWFMDGTTFVSESLFSVIPDTGWRVVATADFNSDGKTDILWRYHGEGALQGMNLIWFMDGPVPQGEVIFSQIPDLSWKVAGTGDFNGDDKTDILWRYYGTGAYQGLNVVWFMDGTTFQSEALLGLITDTAWEIAATGDFDKDGHTDILWRYYGTGTFQGMNDVWYLDGTTFLREEIFSIIPDTNWRIANR
mgnify:CR=1 FL=1